MQPVDLIIRPSWLVPVEPEGQVLIDHAMAVADGRIVSIGPASEIAQEHDAAEVVEASGQVLMPGLINAHTHAAMSLFRGLADDLPLMTWLSEHMWPAEQRWVSAEMVRDGAELAIAEMIAGGITTMQEMYFFPDEVARVAMRAGFRAVVGLIVIQFPSPWAADVDEYFRKGLAVHDELRGEPLVSTSLAPHAPYTVDDAALRRLATLSNELDINIHMHVHETAAEVEQGLAEHGRRPLERLDALGMLTPSLVAVHMTQLEAAEVERCANAGVQVVHCPHSNLKLASGFCPLAKLAEAGANIALGTDGAASNNSLDLFAEMRSAALLAKGVAADASVIPAAQALSMATINGAKALGLAEEAGSLAVGKSADMILVDLGSIATQPVLNVISQLVYACNREQVREVWIAGRRVLKDGELTTIDTNDVLARAGQWRRRILEPHGAKRGDA